MLKIVKDPWKHKYRTRYRIFLCPLNLARSKFAVVIFRRSLSSRIFLKRRKSRIEGPAKIKENKVCFSFFLSILLPFSRFSTISILSHSNRILKVVVKSCLTFFAVLLSLVLRLMIQIKHPLQIILRPGTSWVCSGCYQATDGHKLPTCSYTYVISFIFIILPEFPGLPPWTPPSLRRYVWHPVFLPPGMCLSLLLSPCSCLHSFRRWEDSLRYDTQAPSPSMRWNIVL